MAGFVERGETRSAALADWLARFDFLLFLTAGLSHRYGLIDTPGFFWVLALVGALAALALLLAIAAFRRLWLYGDRGGKHATRAMLVALLILAPFLVSAWQVLRYPALNDVATDLDDPPRLTIAANARNGTMNPVDPLTVIEAERQVQAFPEVTGRRYEAAPDTVIEAVNAIAASRGWNIAGQFDQTVQVGEVTIEVTISSLIFGFAADAAIRITDEGETTYVDMRSISRFAAHDLGSNAMRIRAFLDDLDDEVASRAGGRSSE